MTSTNDAPVDRFCDLVMKGGITSGVVYPAAIERLSHHYRFKNIGGTSAGAIAAAVTAAAEFNRRCHGTRAGFDLLKQLPVELQAEVAPGRRKLLSLFQPQPGAERLFSVLVTALNSAGTARRIIAIAFGALRSYWGAVLASAVIAVGVKAAGADWLAFALLLAAALLVSIGLSVYWDVTRRIVANGFGMCTGLTEDPKNEALVPWLHSLVQRAAGRRPDEPPLTFGDLWDAPGFPVGPFKVAAGAACRSIDLQMFSTNLGHGRPYIFPLVPDDSAGSALLGRGRLFFTRREIARYMPSDVVEWMCEKARPYHVGAGREQRDPSDDDAARLGLMEIPEARHFPIILAARMSLSFPFLFAAVPLWAIDYDQGGKAPFRRCWFSDGGISSNFPMHLFDGLVPSWPTFGINLEPQIKGREDVYLPTRYTAGYGERWDNFDDASSNGAARFGGFLSAIVSTMQNWNDNALARMPGVRDRIARVRLSDDEGGLNLNMESRLIDAVAQRGEKAALQLIDRFVADSTAGPEKQGWDEQRWIRLGVLLKLIEERAPGVIAALDPACPHATGFRVLIDRASMPAGAAPAGYSAPLSVAQQAALRAALDALAALAAALAGAAGDIGFTPIPKPALRVRPPL